MPRKSFVLVSMMAAAAVSFAEIKPPKPGFNLFSHDQDIQLGREAAAQVESKMRVLHNEELDSYIRSIGERLVRSNYAGSFPYTFEVVSDKNINAFSLPGGPVFINTGLIQAADNEAQLAGVMAHEISHVALRHATNQASKADFIQIPAILAGVATGGSMFGQLAQVGLGLGANSMLLKFSRGAESQADYNGALLMADAGYNPIEMARFFEKLEAKYGNGIQFLSDHPTPGNRVRAVEAEVQQMPQQQYTTDSGQFQRIRDLVTHLPADRPYRNSYQDRPTSSDDSSGMRPSRNLRPYSTNAYSLNYPANWQAFGSQGSPAVTIAPREALMQKSEGGVQVGYGVMVSYYTPDVDRLDLRRDTQDLIRRLAQENPGMRVQGQRQISLNGEQALETTLSARSPYEGESETDVVVTAARPEGLFYLSFTAPQSEWRSAGPVFQEMLSSVRFR